MASLSGVFNVQNFSDAGAPASGYRLYTYAQGTTTHKPAYTDAAELIPHTYTSDGSGGLYIALNARGELPGSLYLKSGAYDLRLTTPAGVTVWTRRATGMADENDGGYSYSVSAETVTLSAGSTVVNFSSLTYTPGNNSLMVFVDGLQVTDYSETSATSITFSSAFAADVEVRAYAGRLVALGLDASDIPFVATFNYATETLGKRLRDSGMCVTDFPWLAKFDGSTDDTAAIQACIEWVNGTQGGGTVRLPVGRAKTSAPIKTYGNIEIIGQGAEVSVIEKITTTAGTGTSRARSGAVTDTYAVDSIISIWHADTASGTTYAFRPKITGVTLEGMGNTYGIYAPRMTHAMFTDVQITDVVNGVITYDAWLCKFTRVTCQGVSYGFRHINDGSGVGTGTSCHYDDCWINFDNSVRAPVAGYDFYGLTYSTLTSCACDNLTRLDATVPYVYQFSTCRGITMTACGAESSAAGFLQAITSTVTIINPRAFSMSCNAAWGIAAGIYNDGSTLVFIGADLGAWTGAGAGFYNQIIQGGARQQEIESTMPSGGDGFISYGGGSTRQVSAAGQITNYNGSGSVKTVPLFGSAVYDPPNLPDGSGATTTVTVTGAALGDYVESVSFSLSLQGISVTAYVSAADTVSVRFQNETGGALDLSSGTLRVRVIPQ